MASSENHLMERGVRGEVSEHLRRLFGDSAPTFLADTTLNGAKDCERRQGITQ